VTVSAETATTDIRGQLTRLRAENQALRRQLRDAQRLATVGTMTAMVAHEFNNILTPIINYAHMAQRNPDLTDKALRRAADGGHRATTICNAILGAARDAGEPAEPVNIRQLIDDTLEAMGRPLERDQIDLDLEVADDMVIRARRVELQQVLLNLLMNARTAVLARKSDRKIHICAGRDTSGVTLTVRDNGRGISHKDAERIFQPFYSTDRSAGGSGLGLAFCRQVVTAMGGTISLGGEPGDGAAFTIVLPG